MNTIKNKKIAIVGGGPGGLTLARLLQVNGIDVTVYERDKNKDARAQGATLDLHEESGLRAIRACGLIGEFMANYRPGADKLRIMDKHAHILMDEHTLDDNDRSRPEIDRGPLQSILLASLCPGTVQWDRHCTNLLPDGDGWKLQFNNGTTALADIVVAADGANSRIRPYITSIRPFFSGITAIEGAIHNAAAECPEIDKLVNRGKIFAFGDSKSLIVSAKGDGSIVFYTSIKTTEKWITDCRIDFTSKESILAWFRNEYRGWDAVWSTLFEHADAPFICRPLYCMPPDQNWGPHTNLTIIGDAAHLMPPFAGEGVNMAMLDAVELSDALIGNNYTTTLEAIAGYEQEMLRRAGVTAKDTIESTEALHSPEAIAFMMKILAPGPQ